MRVTWSSSMDRAAASPAAGWTITPLYVEALFAATGCIFESGDVRELTYLASARKSLVSMTYGPAVARGEIDLDATLESIGFDDDGGLLPRERTARIRDLLTAAY